MDAFEVRVTASRLAKGLLAIPSKFSRYFPKERCKIQIIFDNRDKPELKSFLPNNPTVKECRIFGLGRWFTNNKVKPGDTIIVASLDVEKRIYRLALDRLANKREETEIRQRLHSAPTDAAAKVELHNLARITKRRPRQAAKEEILRFLQESPLQPRERVPTNPADRNEGVPAGLRVLLGELSRGKCQICSFTFAKKDGEPYFEIHHLDAKLGHHPMNLLVLCANCHAQFEYASISDYEYASGWLRAVRINNKRSIVRQAFLRKSFLGRVPPLPMMFLLLQAGLFSVQA
jgi:hypothetical protein